MKNEFQYKCRRMTEVEAKRGAGQKTAEICVSESSNEKLCHMIQSKLHHRARFAKQENEVSIRHDFLVFVNHQFHAILH